MTADPTVPTDPLDPVRAALLHTAREEADQLIADARRDTLAVIAGARAQSEALLREARLQGEAQGARDAEAALAQARREARSELLRAKAQACDDLHRRVVDHVRNLRWEETYPAVHDRLAQRARRMLGSGATVADHPHGGVVGTAPGRATDLSLDAMAARALDRAGAEIESLWKT
ncbi:hypothetical protein HEP86_02420 [Streptomyces sp. RPA4-5]|uniref:V-type ATP synthase subunit E n=1 Tax=Streptomyces TaxID=1883 RepID=UPI00143E1A38|nr:MULTISPECIES: V-type ATP synthase subunit E [Streptomyces]MCX4637798.1 V-type ATP synthase subunit E [Streptomyces platensis]QIY53163.1 hypothetical protein HEP86_02420 [Streptomyces sp. RPA4-5]WJY36075.1 V-type ATP synthase subunit E [Streptomyces sp. P9-2B-2]